MGALGSCSSMLPASKGTRVVWPPPVWVQNATSSPIDPKIPFIGIGHVLVHSDNVATVRWTNNEGQQGQMAIFTFHGSSSGGSNYCYSHREQLTYWECTVVMREEHMPGRVGSTHRSRVLNLGQVWQGVCVCFLQYQINLLPIVVLPIVKLDSPLEQDALVHAWPLYLL